MTRFLLGIAALAASTALSAEPLWQNVNVGMTFEQLKGVRPTAHEITPAEKHNYLNECTYVDVDTTINDVAFYVCFTATAGVINGVILYGRDVNTTRASEFKTLLAQKYGAPVMDDCSASAIGPRCSTTWKQNASTTVELVHQNVLEHTVLNVYYKAGPAAAEANKL